MRIAYRSAGCRHVPSDVIVRMLSYPVGPRTPRLIVGRLVFIDVSNRLIRVWDGSASCEVLVPPGCDVRLNNEPIRLRLLEAGDPVEVEAMGSEVELMAIAVRGGRG